MRHKGHTNPPGRRKIIQALTELMRAKDFHSITTAEIAEKAGVAEGLIYKYFKSKKDLLYQVLHDLFTHYHHTVLKRIENKTSAIEKLEIIIYSGIEYYTANRVFARMLLLEVRNSQDYFGSAAYDIAKTYARNILDIIQEGIRRGEIKSDTDPLILRRIILGAIEHACLGEIIFSRDLDAQAMAMKISTILFNGAKA
ncbi:MAG: TetR/AcrR family transcriptional regulator [Desulfobacteraceae bacterium]|nr:MAG: TetR/AcrR family transcriptional regulator [Desulfobacteraceae bacterium]